MTRQGQEPFKLPALEQLENAATGIARMHAVYFRELLKEGVSRDEALEMSNAWVVALVQKQSPT